MAELIIVVTLGAVLIALCTQLGAKWNVAAPLLLVAIGVVASFLPFVPDIEIEPELILAVVLPPLLFSSAVNMPAMNFRREFTAISSLAVVLVIVSSLGLGLVFKVLFPDLALAWCIALGAILSPTDAVATSIAGRAGISKRVTTILEGESLLNDATALVTLRTAVVAAAGAFSVWHAVGQFVWAVALALVVGLVAGRLGVWLRARSIDERVSTLLSLTVPFAASVPSEVLGGSGLVAAVVAGIVTGRNRDRCFRPEQRISDASMWRAATLLLEGAVFLLMGLEMRALVHAHLRDGDLIDMWLVALIALGSLALVTAIRAAYVLPMTRSIGRKAARAQAAQPRIEAMGTAITERDIQRAKELVGRPGAVARATHALARVGRVGKGRVQLGRAPQEPRWDRIGRHTRKVLNDIDYYVRQPLTWRDGTVMVAAGMRGAVTLAAAQTLPLDTPMRSTLVLIAFTVAILSLAVQGGTLTALVRLVRPTLPDPAELSSQGAALQQALHEVSPTREQGESAMEFELRTITVRRAALLDVQEEGLYDSEVAAAILGSMDATELGLRMRLDKQEELGVDLSPPPLGEPWDQDWEVSDRADAGGDPVEPPPPWP